jgi:transketolase
MINPDQKLDPKLFDAEAELKSMRAGAGEGLVIAGQSDSRVVALCADLDESTGLQAFKDKFPDRFIEVGVAEQNLVTVASGMAAMGKISFAASYAIFSPGRNWEQIRTTICYNDVPVKIIGTHAGVNVGYDGGSHQMLEDIALMRALPRMVVISPCDAIEAKKAVIAAAKTKDPTYIRLPREKSQVMTTEDTPFAIGKAQIFWKSGNIDRADVKKKIGIIATGPLLYKALLAARRLEEDGKKAIVMDLSTIKPLDTEAIIKLAHETRGIVTVEEHQIAGGMGSAVAECLAMHFPVPMEFIGVKDRFGQSGAADELIEHYEMGESHIRKAVDRVMLRK